MRQRALKMSLFGEHGKRRGAGFLKSARQKSRIEIAAQQAGRRRGLFQLGDDVDGVAGERSAEIAHRGGFFRRHAQYRFRHHALPARDFGAPRLDDAAQNRASNT